MPIYDYRCDHCLHVFSAVQAYTDDTLEICPSCGKKPRKLMAMPAIVFKGGGWYKTDSRPTSGESGAPDTSGAKIAPSEGATAKEGAPAKESATGKEGAPPKTGDAKDAKPAADRTKRSTSEQRKSEPAKSDPAPTKSDSTSS